jgi:transposase-like protein
MEMRYSRERKEAILKKLLPPMSMTVNELAAAEGISAVTLYAWRKEARMHLLRQGASWQQLARAAPPMGLRPIPTADSIVAVP